MTVMPKGMCLHAQVARSIRTLGKIDTTNTPYSGAGLGAEAHLVQGSLGADALVGPAKVGAQVTACLVCIGASVKASDGKVEIGLSLGVGIKVQVTYGLRAI